MEARACAVRPSGGVRAPALPLTASERLEASENRGDLAVRIPKPSSEEMRRYHRAQQRRQRGAEEIAAIQGQIHALQIELEKKQARLAELG